MAYPTIEYLAMFLGTMGVVSLIGILLCEWVEKRMDGTVDRITKRVIARREVVKARRAAKKLKVKNDKQ